MKKLLIALVVATMMGTGNLAVAGPDWQIIEHGRKVAAERWRQAQAEEHDKRQHRSDEATAEKGTIKKCHETEKKSD